MSYNTLKPQSAIINPNTKDYDIVDGQIAQGNSIVTEIYARLTTAKGSYPYNLNFGCQKLSANVSTQENIGYIMNALQPMINNELILVNNIEVKYSIATNTIQVDLNITDTAGNTIYFNLKSTPSNIVIDIY